MDIRSAESVAASRELVEIYTDRLDAVVNLAA